MKATRHIEAWFAPSLPGVYGPADFVGLPGLVLEVKRETVQLLAFSIKQIKNPNIKKPEAKNVYTQEEYEKKMAEMVQNIKMGRP